MSEPVDPRLGALLAPDASERAALATAPPPGTEALAAILAPTADELGRLRARAARPRRSFAPAAVLAAIAALALFALWPREPALLPIGEVVVGSAESTLYLTPAAVAEGAGTLRVTARDADGAVVWLDEGRVVFEVDPGRPGRRLVVVAGPVQVAVTGTRFAVGHLGDQVQVSVERGSVGVAWPGGSVDLVGGQSWTGPPRPEVAAQAPDPPAPALAPSRRRAPPPPPPPEPAAGPEAARAWASILDAREGGAPTGEVRAQIASFLTAYRGSPLAEEAELLDLELFGSDGDPSAAAAALEWWLRAHPGDPRAPRVHVWLATVAAGRLGDCGRAEASFAALAAGPFWGAVAPFAAACAGR